MFWLMALTTLIFIVAVIYAGQMVVSDLEQRAEQDILRAKHSYQEIIERKESLATEKKSLERRTNKIFQLYELTRDITKTFDRMESVHLFKRYLNQMTHVKECFLLEPEDRRLKEYESNDDYQIVTLKGRKNIYGHLAIMNLREEEREIVDILAHQFVLGMRRIRLYGEIEALATTDSLTRVYTRRYLTERFQEELSRARSHKIPLSFLMLDADHFKRINDQYGHLTGDQVLREIAAMIQDNIREIDFAGRFGGEEFCVVLPDTEVEAAIQVAERIRSAIEQKRICAYDASFYVTVSIGISSFPNDGDQVDEIIDKGDWALYRAKKQGRNTVCAFGIYDERNS